MILIDLEAGEVDASKKKINEMKEIQMAQEKVNEWTASFDENVGLSELKWHHPKPKGL